MISLCQARSLIAEKIHPLPAQPTPLGEAAGRVLRADLTAAEDVPAFDRSAMDGYAVGLDDDSPAFRLAGEMQPGAGGELSLRQGECIRIFTGARLPAGASQVLMQEDVRVADGVVTPLKRGRETHIRLRGEDARRGDPLLAAGIGLGPGELSLLAGAGIVRPMVSPAVRVAHLITGNEIISPGQLPAAGQIRDSNGILVAALILSWGGQLVHQERVGDDFELLRNKLAAADRDYDLLLISGGASVGDYDFGKRLLQELGFDLHFERINLRPGRPLVFATRGAQAAFVVPGNPMAHWVTMHVAVRLAMEAFTQAPPHWPVVRVRLAEAFAFRAYATETFWPARVTIENGGLAVRARRWQSSGDVTGLAGVNALLQLAANAAAPQAGDELNALLLNLP